MAYLFVGYSFERTRVHEYVFYVTPKNVPINVYTIVLHINSMLRASSRSRSTHVNVGETYTVHMNGQNKTNTNNNIQKKKRRK